MPEELVPHDVEPRKELKFFDRATNQQMVYIYPKQKDPWSGWLLRRDFYSDRLVSVRVATQDDLERINKAVIEAHHDGFEVLGDEEKEDETRI